MTIRKPPQPRPTLLDFLPMLAVEALAAGVSSLIAWRRGGSPPGRWAMLGLSATIMLLALWIGFCCIFAGVLGPLPRLQCVALSQAIMELRGHGGASTEGDVLMCIATTDAQANFVFDLLADPDASAPLAAYADWLRRHGQADRAEFLRLAAAPQESISRLRQLRAVVDERRLETVAQRWFRVADVVRITAGTFEGINGAIVQVDPRHARAGLLLRLFCRQTELVWIDFFDLRLVERKRSRNARPS